MPVTTKESIGALRKAHEETALIVDGLDEKRLAAQSGSAEWSVAQVLSHLGSGSEIARSTLLAGKRDPEEAQPVWDRWNAMSPSEQASNFVEFERRLVHALEALDDDELSSKKIDVGFLPAPIDVGFFVGMRLSEVALHRWDVDVAFEEDATIRTYLLPFVLERLPLFAGFFAKPIGKAGKVAIETTEPSRHYLLELREDGASLSEETQPPTDAGTRIKMPAESLLRLTAGRLSTDRTPSKVSVDGELSLDDIRKVFPGY
ncbi:MAG TPA: maleylpyruvate isomerase N-terminal domain-containing protein [Acidimicrobiales bacterium]|nr:maleylpyruvate isomerase N-terminal domain-containing protein [Acidimicrobiales bacterium]